MLASERIIHCQYLNRSSPREEIWTLRRNSSLQTVLSSFHHLFWKICSHIAFQQKGVPALPPTITTFLPSLQRLICDHVHWHSNLFGQMLKWAPYSLNRIIIKMILDISLEVAVCDSLLISFHKSQFANKLLLQSHTGEKLLGFQQYVFLIRKWNSFVNKWLSSITNSRDSSSGPYDSTSKTS